MKSTKFFLTASTSLVVLAGVTTPHAARAQVEVGVANGSIWSEPNSNYTQINGAGTGVLPQTNSTQGNRTSASGE